MTRSWPPESSTCLYSEAPQTDFSRGPHWNHESPFTPVDWLATPPSRGARPLKDTAIKCMLRDQSALSPQLFTTIPWIIAKDLWDRLQDCDKQTLYMWKIMAMSFAQFRESTPYYSLVARKYKQPIRQYFELMNNEDCHWRAVLSFSSDLADVTDLVALSNIKNLVALEIKQDILNRDGVDNGASVEVSNSESPERDGLRDGIVRGWMEMAQAEGSFQHLRILRLQNHKRLSPHVLPMLDNLPQLHTIILRGCDLFTEAVGRCPESQRHRFKLVGWIARRLDWVNNDGINGFEMLNPLLNIYRNSLKKGYRYLDGCAEEEDPKASSLPPSLPIMEFQIASSDLGFRGERNGKSLARSVVILIKASRQSPLERKRATGQAGHEGGKKKRAMKDRGGQDLSSVLSQFL